MVTDLKESSKVPRPSLYKPVILGLIKERKSGQWQEAEQSDAQLLRIVHCRPRELENSTERSFADTWLTINLKLRRVTQKIPDLRAFAASAVQKAFVFVGK